jgi:hypothetical protein
MAISDTINGATSDGAASAAGRDPRRGDLGIAAVVLAHPLMGQQPNDIPAVLARRQADLPLSSALTRAPQIAQLTGYLRLFASRALVIPR